MRLKIVLHIKIQFVSSDFRIINETHFRKLKRSQQAFLCHLADILHNCTKTVKPYWYPFNSEVDVKLHDVTRVNFCCLFMMTECIL